MQQERSLKDPHMSACVNQKGQWPLETRKVPHWAHERSREHLFRERDEDRGEVFPGDMSRGQAL